MFAWSRGSTFPKLKEDNSQYYPILLGGGGGGGCDKSLYLKEDISQSYVPNHCIECFNSPCIEGTIHEGGGLSFYYCLRIGTGLAVRLRRVTRLAV